MQIKFGKFHITIRKNLLLVLVFVLFLIGNLFLGGIIIKDELPRILYLLHLTPAITDNEKKVLNSLSTQISSSQYQEILNLALLESKKTPSIEVGRCTIYPRIVYTQVNTYLIFTNSDSQTHILSFNENKRLTLNPGESKEVFLDFISNAPTVIGYGCDSQLTPAGALFIAL